MLHHLANGITRMAQAWRLHRQRELRKWQPPPGCSATAWDEARARFYDELTGEHLNMLAVLLVKHLCSHGRYLSTFDVVSLGPPADILAGAAAWASQLWRRDLRASPYRRVNGGHLRPAVRTPAEDASVLLLVDTVDTSETVGRMVEILQQEGHPVSGVVALICRGYPGHVVLPRSVPFVSFFSHYKGRLHVGRAGA